MSVLEPGETPIEEVVVEAPPVVAPVAPVRNSAIPDTCANCRRPLKPNGDGWAHVNSRIDDPACPAFCLPELFIEKPIRWGWLNDGKRPDFIVSDGRGSKGNGMAA